MSIVPPPIDAVQIPGNLLDYRPVSSITPFTYRSGMTYQALLEALRVYATQTLPDYMQDEYGAFSDSWQDNLETLQAAVNKALTDQATTVNQQLAQTLAEILAGANVTLNDANILNALKSAASTSLAYLDERYDPAGAAEAVSEAFAPRATFIDGIKTYYAPAPTGGDDSALIQPFLNAAQNSKGLLIFGAGTWKFNLATQQSFDQPTIRGASLKRTIFTPNSTDLSILRMQGGSGGVSGGYVSDVTFTNPGQTVAGVGLELADVCHVQWDRVLFTGNLAEGIRFHVTQPNGFCEFNSGEASFDTSIGLPIRYKTLNTIQTSFHGSGLRDGIVNYDGPCAVQIDQYAFPYNAPMSATFFPQAGAGSIFKNQWAGSKPGFFGTFRVENYSDQVIVAGDPAGSYVLFAGHAQVNTAKTYLGMLYLCDTVYWTAGRTFVRYKPWYRYIALQPGSTSIDLLLQNGEAAIVSVNVTGPNYAARYQLMAWQNPFDNTGTVDVLSHSVYNNSTGIGEITFVVQNYQLVIKNDSFSTQYNASVTIMHLGGSVETDNLRQ